MCICSWGWCPNSTDWMSVIRRVWTHFLIMWRRNMVELIFWLIILPYHVRLGSDMHFKIILKLVMWHIIKWTKKQIKRIQYIYLLQNAANEPFGDRLRTFCMQITSPCWTLVMCSSHCCGPMHGLLTYQVLMVTWPQFQERNWEQRFPVRLSLKSNCPTLWGSS